MPNKSTIKPTSSAIVLLSGGLDSTVSLWWAKTQQYKHIIALTFQYGSKEEAILAELTKRIGNMAGIDNHEFITLDFLAKYSKLIDSSLAQNSKVALPHLSSDELDELPQTRASAKSVWIPARNLVFLSIASALAETIGHKVDIITGFNLEEGTTFPDNSKEFIEHFNKTVELGVLHAQVTVICPLVGLDKGEIIKVGEKLGVPFVFTSSCYNPLGFDEKNHPIHCGICESCLRRKRGFKKQAIPDPTIYQKKKKT
ncbi:MAG: 7-cyano-7-deazaguanine synthase QueC [Asgard group archaeon]|nr:7-cyano-7-deazaguanine synthase QueC [Asgard group archaeon]